MVIHVVQPDETIYSIAEYYKIPVIRLLLENRIINPEKLAIIHHDPCFSLVRASRLSK